MMSLLPLSVAAVAVLAVCVAGSPPFQWGVATSAYQVEGAAYEGGRAASIWDTFSGNAGANGVDFYGKFLDDIETMKKLGVKNFRMSLSWPRILPQGTGEVNQEGIDFYNKVFDALLDAGITPWVTLYHWDLPQALQDKYGGWTNSQIVDDFANYAEVAFKNFGGKVNHWITLNEPRSFCWLGYGIGVHAPGIQDNGGSSGWLCSYNALAAHAAAVEKFRQTASGRIGIALDSEWIVPASSSTEDQAAAQRYLDFNLGLYADPIYFGDFPASVKEKAAGKLPDIGPLSDKLKANRPDFFGLNHYTSKKVGDSPGAQGGTGMGTVDYSDQGGSSLGRQADSNWLYVYPDGFKQLLSYINSRYSPGEVVITESGVDVPGEAGLGLPAVLQDDFRIQYYKDYIQAAADSGAPLSTYFAWSLLDNFEWADGYGKDFGIVYVDRNDGYKRYPKDSAYFLANLFGTG
eukprot:jgi/Botrbrau1/4228/Bobra.0044s0024.1